MIGRQTGGDSCRTLASQSFVVWELWSPQPGILENIVCGAFPTTTLLQLPTSLQTIQPLFGCAFQFRDGGFHVTKLLQSAILHKVLMTMTLRS
jgi:hypothetical protein